MSTQHTPGPWTVDEPHQVFAESVGEYVAITKVEEWNALPPNQVEANARLIAAAPCLLDALQELTQIASVLEATCPGDSRAKENRMDRARAAIAKATGKTK